MSRIPRPPFPPMEAEPVRGLPVGDVWQYEPKWDGFRCIAFRTGRRVELQSKGCRPLGRYFPDVVAALARVSVGDFVLDGELIVRVGGTPSFDELQLRLHPAPSRVAALAAANPATYVVFDLLADGATGLVDRQLRARRAGLQRFAARQLAGQTHVVLSPATDDVALARRWLADPPAGVDGVVAKRRDVSYRSGERVGACKVKRVWTLDCVVGGFRRDPTSHLVSSLLLGLYDTDGGLHHVGFAIGVREIERAPLTSQLEALAAPPGFTGTPPGGASRWSTDRASDWIPLTPTLVVEVQVDHFSGRRMRHVARLLRWRPDKRPRTCTFAQTPTHAGDALTMLAPMPAPRGRRSAPVPRARRA